MSRSLTLKEITRGPTTVERWERKQTCVGPIDVGKPQRFKPTKGIVFIDPEDSTHPYARRIIVPDTAANREMPNIGKVVAMGGAFITKKKVVVQPEFKIGDRVFFKKYTGLWTDFRGKKWIMVKMHDVMAVFT